MDHTNHAVNTADYNSHAHNLLIAIRECGPLPFFPSHLNNRLLALGRNMAPLPGPNISMAPPPGPNMVRLPGPSQDPKQWPSSRM